MSNSTSTSTSLPHCSHVILDNGRGGVWARPTGVCGPINVHYESIRADCDSVTGTTGKVTAFSGKGCTGTAKDVTADMATLLGTPTWKCAKTNCGHVVVKNDKDSVKCQDVSDNDPKASWGVYATDVCIAGKMHQCSTGSWGGQASYKTGTCSKNSDVMPASNINAKCIVCSDSIPRFSGLLTAGLLATMIAAFATI